MNQSPMRCRTRGFTAAELLVVAAIIISLVAILLPTVGAIRRRAQEADTRSLIQQLTAAIENYYKDFNAYPGPISNDNIWNPTFVRPAFPAPVPPSVAVPGFDNTLNSRKITMSENLVLGLSGGLLFDGTTGVTYNPSRVGNGPALLGGTLPKNYPSYFDGTKVLSWRVDGSKTGKYQDDLASADDSIIPEYVDTFNDSMPVLYLRAKPGVPLLSTNPSPNYNSIVTDDSAGGTPPVFRFGAYDVSQVLPYTQADPNNLEFIGVGKKKPKYYTGTATPVAAPAKFPHGLRTVQTNSVTTAGPGYYYPYDAYAYFKDPANPRLARSSNSYILISAGVDRIYGTEDDICSFGAIK